MPRSDEPERSTCATVGCQRSPVVEHGHTPGDEPLRSVSAELCLPCRRVIAFAARIPWGDTDHRWYDMDSLQQLRDTEPVRVDVEILTDDTEGGR